jgi:hypothetical protein
VTSKFGQQSGQHLSGKTVTSKFGQQLMPELMPEFDARIFLIDARIVAQFFFLL